MKFVKTKINQRLINEETNKYEINIVNGYLAGNKGLNIVKDHNSWAVAHQRSGYLIFKLPLPFKQAKEIVKVMSDIIDWTVPEDKVLTQCGMKTGAGKLLKKIRFMMPENYESVLDEIKAELEAQKPKKLPWR